MVVVPRVGQRSEPQIPVQTCWHLLRGQVVRLGAVAHVGLHQRYLAQTSLANNIGRMDELSHRTLHAAHLKYTVVLTHGLHQLLTLIDRERQGLLKIYVLARTARGDGDDGMLVVGRGDNHGVDILTGQNLLVADIHVEFVLDAVVRIILVHAALETVTLDIVDVAAGYDAYIGDGDESAHQIYGLLAQSDEADVDLIIHIALLGLLRRHGCRYRPRKDERRGSQRRKAQEIQTR